MLPVVMTITKGGKIKVALPASATLRQKNEHKFNHQISLIYNFYVLFLKWETRLNA